MAKPCFVEVRRMAQGIADRGEGLVERPGEIESGHSKAGSNRSMDRIVLAYRTCSAKG